MDHVTETGERLEIERLEAAGKELYYAGFHGAFNSEVDPQWEMLPVKAKNKWIVRVIAAETPPAEPEESMGGMVEELNRCMEVIDTVAERLKATIELLETAIETSTDATGKLLDWMASLPDKPKKK